MEISKLKPFNDNNKVTLKDNLKFIIPSIIGILLFMIPIKHEGDVTISAFFTLHAFYIGNEVPDKYLPYNLQDFRMQ